MKKHLLALNVARYTMLHGYLHNIFLKKLIKEWNDEKDIATRSAKLQVKQNDQYMSVLCVLLKIITTNCKHPKKYQDRTNDGIWYCMNCNSDITITKSKKQ